MIGDSDWLFAASCVLLANNLQISAVWEGQNSAMRLAQPDVKETY